MGETGGALERQWSNREGVRGGAGDQRQLPAAVGVPTQEGTRPCETGAHITRASTPIRGGYSSRRHRAELRSARGTFLHRRSGWFRREQSRAAVASAGERAVIPADVRIFVCTQAQDMRRSFDALEQAARQAAGVETRNGAVRLPQQALQPLEGPLVRS